MVVEPTTPSDPSKKTKTGPPYPCPIEKCGRTYKTNSGLQQHLRIYDHDNPTVQNTPTMPHTKTKATPRSNKKGARSRGGGANNKTPAAATAAPISPLALNTEQLSVDEVQFEVDGQCLRVNINDTLEVYAKEETDTEDVESEKKEPPISLPEAVFRKLDNYNICDAPPRPNAYIRFIEKSAEELDGEVEYDVDEEDTAWLGIMNEKREAAGLSPVTVDSLELLMDRLEKESYFQVRLFGKI